MKSLINLDPAEVIEKVIDNNTLKAIRIRSN